MIKQTFDPEADIMQITFAAGDAIADEAEEIAPGIVLHYDTEGRVMAIEIEAISLRLAGTYRAPKRAAD